MLPTNDLITIAEVLTAYGTIIGVGAAIAYYLAISTETYINFQAIILIESIYFMTAFTLAVLLWRRMI